MDVDYDTSSSLSFTDAYEHLPANGPAEHAHIINLGEYASCTMEERMIKLQDAVVTTLYNVSLDALRSFLSPTVHTFKAVFGKRDMQLVVWRKGLEVLVSECALKTY